MNTEIRVEPQLTSYLYSKADHFSIPISGTFELSPICNFTCRMCYVRKTAQEVRKAPRRMQTKDEWIQIAKAAKDNGLLFLLLTGGEPFIWPEFWELYDELIHMGFLISINTNGSCIDKTAIARLKANPPVRINITLYGASDETYQNLCGVKGAFNKVDAAINGLQEAGILVKLNGSLTPENVHDLEACCTYAENHKLIYEPVSYMFPPMRRDESLIGVNDRFTPEEAAYYNNVSFKLLYGQEKYQQRMESILQGAIPPPGLDESCIDPLDGKVRCRAGSASFWITWDGLMLPCGMMNQPVIDTRDKSFSEAWKQLVSVTKNIKLSGICAKCPDQKLCHSCAAMAVTETGTFTGVPTYLCEYVNALKKISLKELNR